MRAWVRRRDRAGQRRLLLSVAALGGALVGWGLVALLGLWLQPRFTALELSAQRLAPSAEAARPPYEQVGRYGALNRGYIVRFPTPDGGLDAVLDHARRQRWRVVARPAPEQAWLERDGVAATVIAGPVVTTAETRVATWVRTRQRQARWIAALVGGVAVAGSVWREVRGRPRPVT